MDLIFDIGANVGRTLKIFKTKSKQVVAFEPNPSLCDRLISKYSGQNVVVDSRGISDKNEVKQFKMSNANTISTFSDDWINNSRFTGDYLWDNIIDVQTITLETAINEYGKPDYIKIDVEGYEYEVLISFNMLLSDTIICFEWAEEQKDKVELILNHIKGLGYNNFGYTEEDEVLFNNDVNWVPFEDFKLIDMLNPEKKEKWGMIYFKYK